MLLKRIHSSNSATSSQSLPPLPFPLPSIFCLCCYPFRPLFHFFSASRASKITSQNLSLEQGPGGLSSCLVSLTTLVPCASELTPARLQQILQLLDLLVFLQTPVPSIPRSSLLMPSLSWQVTYTALPKNKRQFYLGVKLRETLTDQRKHQTHSVHIFAFPTQPYL